MEEQVASGSVCHWIPADTAEVFLTEPEAGIAWSYPWLRRQLQRGASPFPDTLRKSRVALILEAQEHSLSMALSLLCLREDAPFVPVSAALPLSSIGDTLERCKVAGCLISKAALASIVARKGEEGAEWNRGRGVWTVEVHDGGEGQGWPASFTVAYGSAGSVTSVADSDDVAFLLSTSGTTGAAKIVPTARLAYLRNVRAIAASLSLQTGDRALSLMPLSHIGGLSCSLGAVLVSGSSILVPSTPSSPAECITHIVNPKDGVTWYYAAPTIHAALQVHLAAQPPSALSASTLRLVRSGAAHLDSRTIEEYYRLFGREQFRVFPTYSMTECMPVCSPTVDIDEGGGVGIPIGPSVRVVAEDAGDDEQSDQEVTILPHGSVGAIQIRGPSVMAGYEGVDRTSDWTHDGWLRTGDRGSMDPRGRITHAGRAKDVIKRGGEQVALPAVDEALLSSPLCRTAVAFGVANDFWGEEVAAVIVLSDDGVKEEATVGRKGVVESVLKAAQAKLPAHAVPAQVLVKEEGDIPKTASGKYQRRRCAEVFGVVAVDTNAARAVRLAAGVDVDETPAEADRVPCAALHGLRFVLALWVVQRHVGLLHSFAWSAIRDFSFNMSGFTILAGFQMAIAARHRPIQVEERRTYMLSRLASLHALFLLATIISAALAVPWMVSIDGFDPGFFTIALILHSTGFLMLLPINGVHWYQGVMYVFILIFPAVDSWARNVQQGNRRWALALVFMVVALGFNFFGIFYTTPLPWLGTFIAAMMAAYEWLADVKSGPESRRLWAVVADCLSLFWLAMLVVSALEGACNDVLEAESTCFDSFDEFANTTLIFPEDGMFRENATTPVFVQASGRWMTSVNVVASLRLFDPLIVLWVYALAFGHGLTCKLLSNDMLVRHLSPLAYPLYLLHTPVAWAYWYATRGMQAYDWFWAVPGFPFPVAGWELLIIIVAALALAYVVNQWATPILIPPMYRGLDFLFRTICCCCTCCPVSEDRMITLDSEGDDGSVGAVSIAIRRLTGTTVTRTSDLTAIGLDSFGVAALLGILRTSVPGAREQLTMQRLRQCETVGDIADLIDNK